MAIVFKTYISSYASLSRKDRPELNETISSLKKMRWWEIMLRLRHIIWTQWHSWYIGMITTRFLRDAMAKTRRTSDALDGLYLSWNRFRPLSSRSFEAVVLSETGYADHLLLLLLCNHIIFIIVIFLSSPQNSRCVWYHASSYSLIRYIFSSKNFFYS